MTVPVSPHLLEPHHYAWPAVKMGLTMLAAALTQGAGLVLLVPILAALGGGPAERGRPAAARAHGHHHCWPSGNAVGTCGCDSPAGG